jgi:hypothetical protein
MKHLGEKTFILNNRIVKCQISGHDVRDSFAIMPFGLAKYKKDEIDYSLMEWNKRQENKEEILRYLKGDVVYLWELCSKFVERFGPKITIGSTALGELRKYHEFELLNEVEDKSIRDLYYYGGRVECFEKGVIETNVKVYDVNSMYPHVMKDYKHPCGKPICFGNKITKNTFFISAYGKNHGGLCQRTKLGTKFDTKDGLFHTTIHEWKTAIAHGLFIPERIIQTVDFANQCTFTDFVDTYYLEREQAKIKGDTITNLFCKFVLNSAYGKFAQNPENAYDYCILPVGVDPAGKIATRGKITGKLSEGWEPAFIAENQYVIWKKHSDMSEILRINVATAASITGAARSVLLSALATAKRPLYCDTDSIICEDLENVKIDENILGAWKLEKQGDAIAICGRKLYAVMQEGECVKMASKGVKISAEEIFSVASGKDVFYKREVPSFKWDGSYNFLTRKVRMT